jgi:iron complex transport system permease protein
MDSKAVATRLAEATARPSVLFSGLVALLALAALASLYAGRGTLTGSALDATFFELRLQRTLVAFLSGAGLAVGGVVIQGLLRNPLASPSILGTESGAMFGGELTLALVYLSWSGQPPLGLASEMLMPIGCVLGALLALVAVLGLTPLRGSAVALLLTGFLLSLMFLSLSGLLKNLIQESWQLLRVMSVLSGGSLSGAGPRQASLAAVLVIGATLPAWAWSRELDVLMSGEDEASSLGVDVGRMRIWVVIWTAILIAGPVAVGANAAFVGLIVPHVLRRIFGHAHRTLVPAAFLGGGTFLLGCDVLCRVLPLRHEVPLSVVTALIGGPLFLRMLAKLESGAHA